MNRFFRSALFPLVVIVLLVYLASQTLIPHSKKTTKETYSEPDLRRSRRTRTSISTVVFNPRKQQITATLTRRLQGQGQLRERSGADPVPEPAPEEQSRLSTPRARGSSAWWGLIGTLLPLFILLGFWLFLMNQVQGGGSKVMSFGKSRAKRMAPDSPKIGFKDVAGVDEAVEELQEIKEFLENPKKFQALGARIPKGVLLHGPPGTGKTLLARAVAGEAGCPSSAPRARSSWRSSGLGSKRVRALFAAAGGRPAWSTSTRSTPSAGAAQRARSAGEREQTLDQLLAEMDGFAADPAQPSWCWPRPTGSTTSTRPSCAPGASTAGSPSAGPGGRPAARSSTSTCAAVRSTPGSLGRHRRVHGRHGRRRPRRPLQRGVLRGRPRGHAPCRCRTSGGPSCAWPPARSAAGASSPTRSACSWPTTRWATPSWGTCRRTATRRARHRDPAGPGPRRHRVAADEDRFLPDPSPRASRAWP